MPLNSYRIQTESVTQADGTQRLTAGAGYSRHQLHVEGGTTGTLAVKYVVGSQTFNLLDDAGAAITIDLAANTKAYYFEGLIDFVLLVPTSVVGDYVGELRGLE